MGKTGIRTGNTVRQCGAKNKLIYTSQGYLQRRVDNSDNNISVVCEDFGLESVGVEYSINKKARWLLPQAIKDFISVEDDEYVDENIILSIAEKKQHQKRAMCFTAPKTTEMREECLSGRKTHKNKRCIVEKGSFREAAREAAPKTKIHFEVVHPVCSEDVYRLSTCVNKSKKSTKIRKGKIDATRYEFVQEEEDYLDDDDAYDGDSRQDILEQSNKDNNGTVFLGEFFFNLSKTKNKIRNKKNRKPTGSSDVNEFDVNDRHDCVEAIRIQGSEESHTTQNTLSLQPWDVQRDPIATKKISHSEVTTTHLKDIYGQNYIESRSIPRSFAIDISDRIEMSQSSRETVQTRKLNVLIIFSLKHQLDPHTSVYNLYINCGFSPRCSVRIRQTLRKLLKTSNTVNAMIHTIAQNLLVGIPSDELKTLEMNHNSGAIFKPMVSFKTLTSITRNVWKSVDLRDSVIENVFSNACTKAPTGETTCSLTEEERTCGICFFSEDSGSDGLMLSECSHYFCGQCWQIYLMTKLKNGANVLVCPDYGCDVAVDLGTLLSLVEFNEIYKFAMKVSEMNLMKTGYTRWCSAQGCGRLVQFQMGNKRLGCADVVCDCGRDMCMLCGLPSHWPATCENMSDYLTQMKNFQDEIPEGAINVLSSVRGKKCPSCNYFIEKNGGCRYMSCRCGAAFCWICNRSWDITGGHSACGEKGMEHGTYRYRYQIQKKLFDNNQPRSYWYKMAVEQRHRRKPYKQKTTRTAVRKLLQRLTVKLYQEFENRQCFSRMYVGRNLTVSKSLKLFLEDMVDMKLELHRLAEFTAVRLDKDGCVRGKKKLINIIETLTQHADAIGFDISLGAETENIRRLIDSLIGFSLVVKTNLKEAIILLSQLLPSQDS